MSLYTIRPKNKPGSLIAICSTKELLVEEICETCYKQGIVKNVHPPSEEHLGSPNFKAWEPTASDFRAQAEKLEKEEREANR